MTKLKTNPPTEVPVEFRAPAKPYLAYVDHLKARFGKRLQKVSVDAGFTCPNRDGMKAFGGCTYCNNSSFVPPYANPGMSIAEQVDAGVEYLRRRYPHAGGFLVYFQAYSNTYAPLSYLKRLYQQALDHPDVIGLAIGTRPDCIDEVKIDYLSELAQDYFISVEYGLESLDDRMLARLNRGHTVADWVEAVEKTAGRGIDICTHLILGLPGESDSQMIESAAALSRYPINSLKLHHLHVVEKTAMAVAYQRDPFPLLGYRRYIELVMEFLCRLRPDIAIQRLVGETHPRHLIGPNWGVRASNVQQQIETEMRRRRLWQGMLWEDL
ncbi:MAG TPA: TIGR01212 family radical SAM protein [Calditrichia bacterium]|nr:TIGR01212 family radical SAM protein [Calditrichia bacterium]